MKLDIEEIKKLIPHRDPFLFVDTCEIITPGEHGKSEKFFSNDEYFFKGHFPNNPIVPGVIIVEAMAQTAGIVIHSCKEEAESREIVFFAGIDKAKFRIPVVPGDQIVLETSLINQRRNFWVFEGKASVQEKLAAQAEIKLMLQPV